MRPELFALATAVIWGVGSFYGKKGLALSSLDPKMGLCVKLFIALILMVIFAKPFFSQLGQAWQTPEGVKGMVYIIVFEGILAGAVGMTFFYISISSGNLSTVLPLAFTAPLWGMLLAVLMGSEPIKLTTFLGAMLSIAGSILILKT